MILRFSSGSVTPASASGSAPRRRRRRGRRRWPRRSPSRPARPRPRAAARGRRTRRSAGRRRPSAPARPRPTESTPPDSPQMTRASPTCARIRGDLLVDDVRRRSSRPRARRRVQEVLQHLLAERRSAAPRGATARRRAGARRPRTPATGAPDVVAVTAQAGRRLRHRVAVAHPHRLVRRAGRRTASTTCRTIAAGVARTRAVPVLRHRAAERLRPSPGSRSTCRTPAPRPRAARGRAPGAPRRIHAGRAAGEDHRRRAWPRIAATGIECGTTSL